MKPTKNKRKGTGLIIILALAALLISGVCVVTGAHVQNGYVLRVGRTSPKRFRAPRDVENTVATEQLREAARNTVFTQYKINPDIKNDVMSRLDSFFAELGNIRKDYAPIFNPAAPDAEALDLATIDGATLQVPLKPDQLAALVTADSAFFKAFLDAVTQITNDVMDTGVRQDTMNASLLAAREDLKAYNWDLSVENLAHIIITGVIEPNSLPDPARTAELREKEAAKVKPIIFIQGQNIVDEGDIITAEIFAVLQSLGYVNNDFWQNLPTTTGAVLLVLLLLGVAFSYAIFFQKKPIIQKKEAVLLFTLYCACIVLTRVMSSLPVFFMPILLFTMLIALLLDTRLAMVMNIVMALVCTVIVSGDLKFISFFLVTGTLSALLAKYVIERNRTFVIALILSGLSAAAVTAVYLLFDKGYTPAMVNALVYAVLAGLLSVMLCIGTLPFWEAVFGVVTPIKLLDLTNPNSPLLRRLISEAPGTYHHSIIVANLAETAAYDIGANHILARIGGYYRHRQDQISAVFR